MVVCPQCRHVNDEGVETCASCGQALTPGVLRLGPQRDVTERPPIEIAKPKPPSKWRPVIILGAIAAVAVAVAAFYLFEPDPCRGTNFESENFGYCILVPEGWEAGRRGSGRT